MELRQIFNVFVTGKLKIFLISPRKCLVKIKISSRKLKIVLDSNYSYDIQFNFFVFKGENRKF